MLRKFSPAEYKCRSNRKRIWHFIVFPFFLGNKHGDMTLGNRENKKRTSQNNVLVPPSLPLSSGRSTIALVAFSKFRKNRGRINGKENTLLSTRAGTEGTFSFCCTDPKPISWSKLILRNQLNNNKAKWLSLRSKPGRRPFRRDLPCGSSVVNQQTG